MTYSCAIFSDPNSDALDGPLLGSQKYKLSQLPTHFSPSDDESTDSADLISHTPLTCSVSPLADTLEVAQQRKLAYIVARARILPGHRVLEIGTGWGSLAFYIARHIPDVQIDTITLSDNQCAHVRTEVARQGFGDRIRVHLLDYREMPLEWESSFDRVVSIEMVEAVGLENIDVYWATIDRVLKNDSGVGVIQGTTIPEASG
jgi:cyclopropane-fatty-acyl-phospholipid synthase